MIVEPEPLYTTPITAQFGDGLEHEVTDAAVCAARTGEYPALCGVVFVAAPLIAEEGPSCPACAAILAAHHAAVQRAAAQAARQHRRDRRRALLRRLLHP